MGRRLDLTEGERRERRLAQRARASRKWRAKQAGKPLPVEVPDPPADPAGALADWCRERLRVPPGHPRAGQPFDLPEFGIRFIRDALTHRESLLCVARKNGKSAIVAAFLLARLTGPLRTAGYRGGVVSVNREKAGELKQHMEALARASALAAVKFWRSPAPGRVTTETGEVDFLSADSSAGHAAGFDDAVIDEIGLLKERDRGLVNGMRTAISARDGRFMALSIRGDAPFTAEMIERRGQPGIAVHLYAAPEDCEIDDEAAWAAANPGLGTVKSLDYMRDEARRVLATPGDQAAFRAFDLNLPQDPSRELLCALSDWQRCVQAPGDLPPREGPVCIGFDLGGSSSMTALAAIWPLTMRIETWGAFPVAPDLAARGRLDGVGGLYARMEERGEISTYPGRVTPVAEFLADCAGRLAGSRVVAAGADRFRRAEAIQALTEAGLHWPMEWRGQGAGGVADGSADVRAFQRLVLAGKLKSPESLLMASAIKESSVRYDGSGNPALEKARSRGRIDALSAAVIAAGLAERYAARPRRRRLRSMVVG